MMLVLWLAVFGGSTRSLFLNDTVSECCWCYVVVFFVINVYHFSTKFALLDVSAAVGLVQIDFEGGKLGFAVAALNQLLLLIHFYP